MLHLFIRDQVINLAEGSSYSKTLAIYSRDGSRWRRNFAAKTTIGDSALSIWQQDREGRLWESELQGVTVRRGRLNEDTVIDLGFSKSSVPA